MRLITWTILKILQVLTCLDALIGSIITLEIVPPLTLILKELKISVISVMDVIPISFPSTLETNMFVLIKHIFRRENMDLLWM